MNTQPDPEIVVDNEYGLPWNPHFKGKNVAQAPMASDVGGVSVPEYRLTGVIEPDATGPGWRVDGLQRTRR